MQTADVNLRNKVGKLSWEKEESLFCHESLRDHFNSAILDAQDAEVAFSALLHTVLFPEGTFSLAMETKISWRISSV